MPDTIAYTPAWETALEQGLRVGGSSAPLQLVEFIDLQCPACRRFHEELKVFRKDAGADLAVTYVNLPLNYHKSAKPGALGLICAHNQDRSHSFVEAAFAHQTRLRGLGDSIWIDLAMKAGVPDVEEFRTCITAAATAERLEAQLQVAHTLNIPATPTVIFNGWQFGGPMPQRKFLRRFARELREGVHQVPNSPASPEATSR